MSAIVGLQASHAAAGADDGQRHPLHYDGPGSTPSVDSAESLPGLTPVADHDGDLAGYLVDDENTRSMDGDEAALPLGDGRTVTGSRVVDSKRVTVGYLVASIGFVDRGTATNPPALARLVDDFQAQLPKRSADEIDAWAGTPPQPPR